MVKRKAEDDQSMAHWRKACKIWFCPENEIISNELRDLPRPKREIVWTDLAGNSQTTLQYEEDSQKDTPENITRALAELDQDIARMPTFMALKRAQQTSPAYVNNDDFRLKFLRCERFHVKNAANRMLRHFEEKKTLFGEERLGRDIRLSELTDNDLESLESGWTQILPGTDKGGRRVMFIRRSIPVYKERVNYVRRFGRLAEFVWTL
jgi:hypothetical protein